MHDQEVKLNTHFEWIDLHKQQLYWTVWTWIPLISTVLTISNVTSFSPGDYCEVNLCHNGGTCVTGVGDDPFICICADGFGGDTCNLTETGTWQRMLFFFLTCFFFYHSCCLLTSSLLLFSQGPAAQTPARTTDCVRWWHRPDEGMFSTSTSASASQASRGCTARPVSSLWKSCWSACSWNSRNKETNHLVEIKYYFRKDS